MLGLRWAQRAKAWFVALTIFLGRLPVTVFKSLLELTGSPIFFSRTTFNRNFYMSIKNYQAIQKSCLDHESNASFTLGSESESMVCGTYDIFGSTAGHGFEITK